MPGNRVILAETMSDVLSGGNAAYLEALYETFLEDPQQVEEPWRSQFVRLAANRRDVAHGPVRNAFAQKARQQGIANPTSVCNPLVNQERKQLHVLNLIDAYRFSGLRHADLDPLRRQEKPYLHELDPDHYGFSDADLATEFTIPTGIADKRRATLNEIINILKDTYCRTIGAEFMYLSDVAQKAWIQEKLERHRGRPYLETGDKKRILERLTAAETLEKYLHNRYVGQKRFSLEGCESLIPCLDFLIDRAGRQGAQELVIGMAHRGRLNVLVNILGKRPQDLFLEFEGKHREEEVGSGDVKYHQGFSSDVATVGGPVHIALAFNPSHLEIVDPVVEGSVRARQQRRGDQTGKGVIPVLIHGDAAFAGQGVVMETLAMSQTRGFRTGGTVHIVVNNQIGFTLSDPRDSRSSLYCTDVVKMIEAPVFHVNADDPEAVVFVTRLAVDFRMTFGKDVVVDLVCYRRLGHNEQDEPSVTQPLMYQRIQAQPPVRGLYQGQLATEGVLADGEAEAMIDDYRAALERGESSVRPMLSNHKRAYATEWASFKGQSWRAEANTTVPLAELRRLGEKLVQVPEGFAIHPRLDKILADRRRMFSGEMPVDWGMAENLAYASLLESGYGVRISGQDSGRGTFFHRHAVWHDQKRESWEDGTYVPLQHLSDNQPHFLVIDSLLSEEAVLAFEYGYATAQPDELTIWEAQFGDFADGAQVVIDRFIVSGERKWGRLCGLTLFLPHGDEGQGPEHSSARIERFLSLCAEESIQVCIPTLPAQFFHLLRRQMLRPYRRPLVVFTPKSLLRHRESTSPLEELSTGHFLCVLEDPAPTERPRRLVLCAGKIYFELAAHRREHGLADVDIVRIEQFYPLPEEELRTLFFHYKAVTDILWVQEEPRNMGGWYFVERMVRPLLWPNQKLACASPAESASPAAGYMFMHLQQQKAVVEAAFAP